MKILHINTFDSGGAANSAIRLHKGLLELGMDSKMLFLNRSDAIIPFSAYYLTKAQNLLMKGLYKCKLYPTIAKRTEKIINKKKISGEIFSFAWSDFDITTHPFYLEADIINLHWVAGFLDYKSFFRKNKKPVVWTLHDQYAFTGTCHYSGSCHKFESNCIDCPLVKSNKVAQSLQYKIKALTNFNNLVIVSPSKWLHELSMRSILFKQYKHFHIPYGLDTNIFKPHNYLFAREVFSIPENKKVFLFVCDDLNNKRKGFSLLLDALSKVNNDNVLFYAVGYAGKTIPSVLTQGKVKDERLLALLYSAADAFILPSLEDNLPNTMLESLACGTPVIAFPHGGIPDLIEHNENGLIAEGSVKGLFNSINRILNNEITFDHKKISEDIKHNFSLVNQAQKYIGLYNTILSQTM